MAQRCLASLTFEHAADEQLTQIVWKRIVSWSTRSIFSCRLLLQLRSLVCLFGLSPFNYCILPLRICPQFYDLRLTCCWHRKLTVYGKSIYGHTLSRHQFVPFYFLLPCGIGHKVFECYHAFKGLGSPSKFRKTLAEIWKNSFRV